MKVLIVDDEEYVRDFLGRMFQRRGHEVFFAADGEQCLTIHRKTPADFIFLDIHLPGKDGISVFREILPTKKTTKVFFITGEDNPMIRKQAESLGADGYFLKPLDVSQIIALFESSKQ
jgi:DNA-binding response OmpR family regulator